MKKLRMILAAMALLLCGSAMAKDALVIIAHGSPGTKWNAPVLALEETVRAELAKRGDKQFEYVRVALMEFSQPNIASVMRDCEAQGVDRVFAVPLFIAPSSHSEEDIPNILGHKYSAATMAALLEEKAEIVDTKMEIVLGATLSTSDILGEVMAERVKALSQNAAEEGVVLLAHGDWNYRGFWETMLKEAGERVEKETGVKYLDGTFVAMGQQFKEDALAIVQRATAEKKRVIVQGVYLSTGVKVMADYTGTTKAVEELLQGTGKEVIFSDKGILPESTERVSQWIVDQAEGWAAGHAPSNESK